MPQFGAVCPGERPGRACGQPPKRGALEQRVCAGWRPVTQRPGQAFAHRLHRRLSEKKEGVAPSGRRRTNRL